MHRPFYSVIVVSFNAGSKLNKTLQSILSQTFKDYEIILKDGGSTDGSIENLPEDDRIHLLLGFDSGIYDAMNQAVSLSRGRILYFLDCGDTLHDDNVLQQVADFILKDQETAREKAPEAVERKSFVDSIYYGNVIEMQTRQEVLANPQMSHFAMYRYLPCHQACFYTRSLFRRRQFDTAYKVRGDYEHFLYCVIRLGARTVAMPFLIADYEGGGWSETPEGKKLSSREHRSITAVYFSRKESFLFRMYLIVTLQPLREKIARGRYTAAVYDRIKNAVYRHRSKEL